MDEPMDTDEMPGRGRRRAKSATGRRDAEIAAYLAARTE